MHLIASNSDWVIAMSVLVIIDQVKHFGVGFTTQEKPALRSVSVKVGAHQMVGSFFPFNLFTTIVKYLVFINFSSIFPQTESCQDFIQLKHGFFGL